MSRSSFAAVLTVLAVVGATAVPAAGASPDSEPPADADTKAADEVEVSQEAREHFRRGVALLEAGGGTCDAEAYGAFKAAYKDSPSPKILGNIGLCAMHLERDGEAIDSYQRYLADSGAVSEREHEQILADLKMLEAGAGQLSLSIAPASATVIDRRLDVEGTPIENRYEVASGSLDEKLRAGTHQLVVSSPGHETATVELTVEAGGAHQEAVQLIPTPTPSSFSDLEIATIVVGASTGVLVIATIVTGSAALSTKADFERAVDRDKEPDAEDLLEDGETLNLVTDILLGASVLAGAATGLLLYYTLSDETDSAMVIAPSLGPTFGGILFATSL